MKAVIKDPGYNGWQEAFEAKIQELKPVLTESIHWIATMNKTHEMKNACSGYDNDRAFLVRFFFCLHDEIFTLEVLEDYFIYSEGEENLVAIIQTTPTPAKEDP